MEMSILDEIKRLKAISEIGLLYSTNDYDLERYTELREIWIRLSQAVSGHSTESLQEIFPLSKEYPTAKVDIRGMLISDERKILLVKERADGRWSLPGGWADVGYTPREIIVKEFKEETGLEVTPARLLAVFDKRKHPHPPNPFYIYKLAFHCLPVSGDLMKGFDILDVDYFDIDHLPELSEERILESQIRLLYRKIMDWDTEAYVD
jgi:ADP-ribose pyrophosphatase YjhB (NUDIX family)